MLVKSASDFISCPSLLRRYREHTDQLGVPTVANTALYASLLLNFPFARKSHTTVMGQDVQIIRGLTWRTAESPLPSYPPPMTPEDYQNNEMQMGA